MPSEISVLVTLLGPGEMLPAAFLAAFGDRYGKCSRPSPVCRQEDHTERDGQGLRMLPRGQALALGWEDPSRGARGEKG